VDQCVQDPKQCATGTAEEVLGGKPADNETEREEEDGGEGGAVPPEDSSRGSKEQGPGSDRGPSGPPVPLTDEPATAEATETQGVPAVAGSSDGILGRLAEGVTDAARRFAFPLGVAALVAAFLLVQGRVDSRDPKLATAPIDSRDDLVMFR
jgi:hypothetical protein